MRDLRLPDERHPEKAHRPDQAQPRKPDWIRVKAPTSAGYRETARIVRENRLVTVCEEAGCPNLSECWADGTATFMVLGERCTRACGFCLVDTRHPEAPDAGEAERVAEAAARMGLGHVAITMVARDDLADGGAAHVADVVRAIRRRSPGAAAAVRAGTIEAVQSHRIHHQRASA